MTTDTKPKRRRRTNPAERLDDIAALLGKLNPDALYKLGEDFGRDRPIGADILRKGLTAGGLDGDELRVGEARVPQD